MRCIWEEMVRVFLLFRSWEWETDRNEVGLKIESGLEAWQNCVSRAGTLAMYRTAVRCSEGGGDGIYEYHRILLGTCVGALCEDLGDSTLLDIILLCQST